MAVYLIECNICCEQYTGSTKTKFRSRANPNPNPNGRYIGSLHILTNTYTTAFTTKQVVRKVLFPLV